MAGREEDLASRSSSRGAAAGPRRRSAAPPRTAPRRARRPPGPRGWRRRPRSASPAPGSARGPARRRHRRRKRRLDHLDAATGANDGRLHPQLRDRHRTQDLEGDSSRPSGPGGRRRCLPDARSRVRSGPPAGRHAGSRGPRAPESIRSRSRAPRRQARAARRSGRTVGALMREGRTKERVIDIKAGRVFCSAGSVVSHQPVSP